MFVSRSAVPKVAIDVETLKEAGADNESKVNQNVSTPTVNVSSVNFLHVHYTS